MMMLLIPLEVLQRMSTIVKKRGMFVATQRTEGVSSDIGVQDCEGHDTYVQEEPGQGLLRTGAQCLLLQGPEVQTAEQGGLYQE